MTAPERKEWVKVSRAANGNVVVSVTVQEGTITSRWAVKAYSSGLAKGLTEARTGATIALADLQAALGDQ